ncbi:MAG: M14 family metallopeptidase [Actinomycetota bacterium]
MRKLTVVSLALVLLAALAPIARTDTPKLALVRVKVTSPEQASYLMTRFDESHNHSASEIELVLWPRDRAALDQTGYEYRVVTEDLVARDRELNKGPHPLQVLPGPDYSDYRRLPDYNREMQEIADANPSIVKHFQLKRLSLEGRPIFGLEIAHNVKSDDGRPVFYMDALHHAREWPASEFTMIFAHYLVEGYGKNPEITSLLRKTRVILVPVVNVDGFNYSRESVTSAHSALRQDPIELPLSLAGLEGYWRKNRRSETGITAPVVQVNPDAYGVDPNRNYAYLWGDQQGGSSNNIFDQTYRGEAPFSEPEVANVRDIVTANNVTGLITNHTVQASVLRAGGGLAPEDRILKGLGQKMADLLKFMNNPTVGYPTTGTTDDWSYALMSVLGYTIEHGGSGFHCAYDECVGMPTDRTMKAFMVLLRASADPQYHSVLTGKVADGPAKLTLSRKVKTPLSPGNPLDKEFVTEKVRITINSNPDGSFEWHVSPSDQPWTKGKVEGYTLTITAGGKTKTMEVVFTRGERLDLGTIRL